MPRITELFDQPTLVNYMQNRVFPTYLGETLFPATKINTLKMEYLRAGAKVPVLANVEAFDTEAKIGSREASVATGELGYIKRKMQLKEEDIIALNNPRNAAEEQYLKNNVYNDIDSLTNSVLARIELMRMEALSTGFVTATDDDLPTLKVNYQIPAEHKASPAKTWDDEASDPIADIQSWVASMDEAPTRAITSLKVQTTLLRNKSITDYFKVLGQLPTLANLNNLLTSFGLPAFITYDRKYKVQNADGTYTTKRYFPEDAFVMFSEGTLGQTVFGPTPEENRYLSGGSAKISKVGNVFVTVYETSLDPIATWEKAAATALPSFEDADNVFQASKVISDPKA